MGQLFPGKSVCQICGMIMNANDELASFPAFLPKEHDLWCFTDDSFHKHCFDNWSKRSEFLSLYHRWREILASAPKKLLPPEEMLKWHEEAFKNYPS